MALSDVTFVKGQGGLGRPLAGEDHISGLVYYSSSLPSGFDDTTTADRIKAIYSLEEAESLGIYGDYSLETVPTTDASIEVETAGAANDVVEIRIKGVSIAKITLGTSPTVNGVAAALLAAVNAGTDTHGYKAVAGSSADIVKLKAPAGIGSSLNDAGVGYFVNGATSSNATVTQFDNGVADPFIVLWYHIKEFFRIHPKGVLYVGIFAAPTSNFVEITDLQKEADGDIRQVGVYSTAPFDLTAVDALQARAESLEAEHKPLSILYAADITNLTVVDAIDLKNSDNNKVSVVIGQDGNNFGNKLFTYAGKSITCLGAALGAVSRSKVSENIGWVKNFNLSEVELDVIKFADGSTFRSKSAAYLEELNNKRYIFLRKHIGINGSYFNDSHTATNVNSDYAYIENNRTIDKAIRNIRVFVLPELNGPLYVAPDGTLSEDTTAYFKSLSERPLEQMQRDGELSAFEVIINPEQNVLAESKLNIIVKLVPVGVARQIVVNIGFTVKIS